MSKKVTINIALLAFTYMLPLFWFNHTQNEYGNVDLIQRVVFGILFMGAALVTYLNYKNRKQTQNLKWLWLIFEIVGILGCVYSLFFLFLMFVFRNGIGF